LAKSAAQVQQNLQDKTAVYTAWTMARSLVQKEQGVEMKFVIPKEGANLVPNVASLIKGAKNPNAAKLFIDFLLTDEVQKLYATKLYYNPATSVKLPDETAKMLEFDRSKVKQFDLEIVGSKTPEWIDRFNKEIAPKVGK
jgi:putative spermidine/putrescine transport system substrate-binding protein